MVCPSEEDIACFVEGRTSPDGVRSLLLHVDSCAECRTLLANTMRAVDPSPNERKTGGMPRTFVVGDSINGRYRVDRFLSHGGMGEVYEAWDLVQRERVALKTITCTFLDNSRLCHRMRAEVDLARRVAHPNVCRILEFGLAEQIFGNEVETVPFFTMEYLKGETLANYAARLGQLPEKELVDIALQILDGLSAIHAAGIIHRDLKPENVFLIDPEKVERRVVVMDFGLARPLERESSFSSSNGASIPGTPAYMAPEQVLGQPPSIAWDIYAFGVILFRLVSGQLPFKGNTSLALAMARLREPAPPLSRVVPRVNREIEKIVARCLQQEPAKRYPTVSDVQRAFEQVGREKSRRLPSSTSIWLLLVACGILAAMLVFAR